MERKRKYCTPDTQLEKITTSPAIVAPSPKEKDFAVEYTCGSVKWEIGENGEAEDEKSPATSLMSERKHKFIVTPVRSQRLQLSESKLSDMSDSSGVQVANPRLDTLHLKRYTPDRSDVFSQPVHQTSVNSFRSLRSLSQMNGQTVNPLFPVQSPLDHLSLPLRWNPYSHTDPATQTTVTSLASIGLGCTDGKYLYLRHVPSESTDLVNHTPQLRSALCDDQSTVTDFSELSENGTHHIPKHQQWNNQWEFMLSCVGYAVGLGNVWRFPYLCYKSGGGAFLVPYFSILFICGIPLMYMELALGQYTHQGPVGAIGKLCPLFKGAGVASVIVSFILCTYYNVISSWSLYYFFSSFTSELPWKSCSNKWNTENCFSNKDHYWNNSNLTTSASQEYYDHKVLQITSFLEGSMRWELVACLVMVWVFIYFSLWRSVKSSKTVAYFTATFPYVLFIAFLVRVLTLDGAQIGLQYFLQPKWELLLDTKVWVNATAQSFNSFGIAFGTLIAFSSYNTFSSKILPSVLCVSAINAFTSVLVGIIVFSILGNMAVEQNRTVDNIVVDGPGLIFVVYPQVITKMPVAPLWSVLFFFMLLCLGLNSQFAFIEVVVTSIEDAFYSKMKYLHSHKMLVLLICITAFLLGLPNMTQGGIYFFQLIDYFAAAISVAYLAFFEVIGVMWFYGADQLARNIKEMTGSYPSLYFRICWQIAAPMLLGAILLFSLVDFEHLTYNKGQYIYPHWAEVLGMLITSVIIMCILVLAALAVKSSKGDNILQKLKNSIKYEFICTYNDQIKDSIELGSKSDLSRVQGLPNDLNETDGNVGDQVSCL